MFAYVGLAPCAVCCAWVLIFLFSFFGLLLQFDTNPAGEDRNHPYYDAPEDKLKKGVFVCTSLSVNVCIC